MEGLCLEGQFSLDVGLGLDLCWEGGGPPAGAAAAGPGSQWLNAWCQ